MSTFNAYLHLADRQEPLRGERRQAICNEVCRALQEANIVANIQFVADNTDGYLRIETMLPATRKIMDATLQHCQGIVVIIIQE